MIFNPLLPDETPGLCALVPPRILEALRRYATEHSRCGDFVMAVLENNLVQAVGRADETSMAALKEIVTYCYNALPSPCWGSPEKVKAWLTFPPMTESEMLDETLSRR